MEIITCIASTTHVDNNNDRITKGALDGMASQTNATLIPQLIDHDPKKHIGVTLYGKVFQLDDGEHALGIVVGIYENDEERKRYAPGLANEIWQDYREYIDVAHLQYLASSNYQPTRSTPALSDLSLPDLLERYLNSTEVSPCGDVYEIKKLVASTGDLKIEVYPKDHYPPHFHVVSKSRNLNARFDIETLDLISEKAGNIKQKDIKKVRKYFENNPHKLELLKDEHRRMCE